MLGAFFDEMWPVLRSASATLRSFISSEAHTVGDELPGKTFTATPGFIEHQTGEGALTHTFEIGGISSRRMVVPYQMWMLRRIDEAISPCIEARGSRTALESLLSRFSGGSELLSLETLLDGCRVRKEGARLFSE